MKKTNRNKNHVKFNVDKESKNKRMTRRNKNKKDAKNRTNRTINASLRIKNRTLTPMPETVTAPQNATMAANAENQMRAT